MDGRNKSSAPGNGIRAVMWANIKSLGKGNHVPADPMWNDQGTEGAQMLIKEASSLE